MGKTKSKMKPKLVATPLDAIRTAKQFLYYAWFLYDAVQRGAIKSETFADEIREGQFKLRWPPENRTPAALERHAWNNVLAAMSITAIAADRALDETLGPKPVAAPADLQSDRDAARVVMYMLRSAYAHNPLNPTWWCKGWRYCGVFRITELNFTLDTTALDGQPWNIKHVGGPLGYFALLDFCQKVVETASAPSP